MQRLVSVVAGLSLFACSQGASPTAPQAARPSVQAPTGAITLTPGESQPGVESSGVKPEGFKLFIKTDPGQNENGQIVADGDVTVEFDACRSTSGDGSPLYYYFDWDFDHNANVWGGDEACRQTHTYRGRAVDDPKGNDEFRTNVCVSTGDVRTPNPANYVSCREFHVVVPRVAATCGPVDDNFTNLSLEALVITSIGNLSANDCDRGTFLSASIVDIVNVSNVFVTGTVDNVSLSLSCATAGPFEFTGQFVTTTGASTIRVSGNCTPP